MRIGVFGFQSTIDGLQRELQAAVDGGFDNFWMPQVFGLDALTALSVAAREVPDIEVGTAVIPTWPRHPMMLAQQALTTQMAIGDRLNLGIGLTHQPVVEGMWGTPFDKPVRHLREYLEQLMPLLADKTTSQGGEIWTSRGQIDFDGVPAPRVYVAALGTQTLKVTGRLCGGTITWMVGATTLREHTVPTITEAAAAADRPAPEIIVGVPACVTDDVDGARQRAAKELMIYGQLPSYRAMLDREGLAGPEDMAVIGTADEVVERLAAFGDTGTTTLTVSAFGSSDERAATMEAARQLL